MNHVRTGAPNAAGLFDERVPEEPKPSPFGADRHTQNFLIERSYPAVEVVEKVHLALSDKATAPEDLRARLRIEEELFETAVEKLWLHGGLLVDSEQRLSRGQSSWRKSYTAQREHRFSQLERMWRLAEKPACRMATLVQHFGDQLDSGAACGVCDVCSSEHCLASSRAPDAKEAARIKSVLDFLAKQHAAESSNFLRSKSEVTSGQLFKATLDGIVPRRDFEHLRG